MLDPWSLEALSAHKRAELRAAAERHRLAQAVTPSRSPSPREWLGQRLIALRSRLAREAATTAPCQASDC